MAYFTRAQSNPQFTPGPNPNPQFQDLSPTLDSIFNAYMASKQDARAVEDRQRTQAVQDATQTAQFGAPLTSFTPGQMQAAAGSQPLAASGIGPMNNQQLDTLAQLRTAFQKIGGRDPQTVAMQGQKLREGEADIDLKTAQADKLRRDASMPPGLDPAKKAELANKLRDDLNKASQPFVTMRNYYAKIQASAKDATGASDWALIYGFNKMLDEASAVRDPEVQNTMNTGNLYESISAATERLKSGKKLDDNVRANLVAHAKKLYGAMEPYQSRTVEQYRGIAKRQQLDDRDVVIDSSFIPEPTSGVKKAPEARFSELLASGKSEAEAYAAMAQEGY